MKSRPFEREVKLLSSRQIAERLGVTPNTILKWIKRGWIEVYGRTPAGQYRFDAAQIDRVLDRTARAIEIERNRGMQENILAARERIRRMREAG